MLISCVSSLWIVQVARTRTCEAGVLMSSCSGLSGGGMIGAGLSLRGSSLCHLVKN